MKFTSQVTAALASLGLLIAASAQDAVKFNVPGVSTPASQPAAKSPAAPAAQTTAPAQSAVKFSEAQLMEAYGYIFALRSGLPEEMQALEFSPANRESVARGFGLALAGKDLPIDQAQAQQMQVQIQEFLKPKQEAFAAKRQAFLTQLRLKNINEAAAFFTKLKAENKNVVELPSGLRYEILKPATGPVPKLGQLVTIHYTGTFVNGEVFGTSSEAKEPIELPMVAATGENPNGTIAGMVEGLTKVGVGGKAKFYIPPSLAYGDSGNPSGIPPGATLIFEVEVVSVKDAPKTPAAK
jgi:FKBP-type peptidyl-prolyl cis-trans isomerase